jgi:hypothetical protein
VEAFVCFVAQCKACALPVATGMPCARIVRSALPKHPADPRHDKVVGSASAPSSAAVGSLLLLLPARPWSMLLHKQLCTALHGALALVLMEYSDLVMFVL